MFKIIAIDEDQDRLGYFWHINHTQVASDIDSFSIYIAPHLSPSFTVTAYIYDKADTISYQWLVKTPQAVDTHELPFTYQIMQNHPNPFNSSTTISFHVASPQFIEIAIYDIGGRRIRTLKSAQMLPGIYSCIWNADSDHNESVPSGIYYCVLRAGNFQKAIKMLLLR